MFINEAYAAAEPVMETTPALSGTLIQLALILLIFYFLLIRPQQKRVKEHVSLVDQLKVGDAVVTNSGIHGVIARVDETTLSLEIAPNVVIELEKMDQMYGEKLDILEEKITDMGIILLHISSIVEHDNNTSTVGGGGPEEELKRRREERIKKYGKDNIG